MIINNWLKLMHVAHPPPPTFLKSTYISHTEKCLFFFYSVYPFHVFRDRVCVCVRWNSVKIKSRYETLCAAQWITIFITGESSVLLFFFWRVKMLRLVCPPSPFKKTPMLSVRTLIHSWIFSNRTWLIVLSRSKPITQPLCLLNLRPPLRVVKFNEGGCNT